MQYNFTFFFFWLARLMEQTSYGQERYNKRPEYLKANNIWTFGDLKGLNFSTGTAKADSSMILGEGAASVCDPRTGQLLFYTNGVNVWNKKHEIMPNGSGLLGPQNFQDVCVVPFIDNPNKYYIFIVYGFHIMEMGGPGQIPPKGDLMYTVVDMTLDNGLGDVLPSTLNTSVASDDPDSFATGIVAVPGENCDVWLMTHAFGKSVFKAYHITENGINRTPVNSQAGDLNLNGFGVCNWWCYISGSYVHSSMTISPDRKRIVVSSADVLSSFFGQDHPKMSGNFICKFDAATGKVSDAVPVGDHLIAIGEAAFSPDNTKLYLQKLVLDKNELIGGLVYKSFGQILQYDISRHDSLHIAQSAVILADSLVSEYSDFGSSEYGNFKLYNDTIYVRPYCFSITTINKPNEKGKACDFTIGIPVEDRTLSLHSELIHNWPDTLNRLATDTAFCSDAFPEELVLRPLLAADGYQYLWNDNTRDTSLSIQSSGTYWVKYTDGCHYRTDTFKIARYAPVEPIITINIKTLSTTATYRQYQWLLDGEAIPGATSREYQVLKNGIYQVQVTDANGCSALSDEYPVTNFNLVDEEGIVENVVVYPNPTTDILYVPRYKSSSLRLYSTDGKLQFQGPNRGVLSLADLADGLYFLYIYDHKQQLLKAFKVNRQLQ